MQNSEKTLGEQVKERLAKYAEFELKYREKGIFSLLCGMQNGLFKTANDYLEYLANLTPEQRQLRDQYDAELAQLDRECRQIVFKMNGIIKNNRPKRGRRAKATG